MLVHICANTGWLVDLKVLFTVWLPPRKTCLDGTPEVVIMQIGWHRVILGLSGLKDKSGDILQCTYCWKTSNKGVQSQATISWLWIKGCKLNLYMVLYAAAIHVNNIHTIYIYVKSVLWLSIFGRKAEIGDRSVERCLFTTKLRCREQGGQAGWMEWSGGSEEGSKKSRWRCGPSRVTLKDLDTRRGKNTSMRQCPVWETQQ